MRKIILSSLFLCLFSILSLHAQLDVSFEFQAYPTGLIPGLRVEKGIGDHHALFLRAGYNWIRHRDLGVQDLEEGDGFGGTLGYRYYFKETQAGFFLGVKSDVWRSSVDWEEQDDAGMAIESGTSEIIVVQPTAEAGFLWAKDNGTLFCTHDCFWTGDQCADRRKRSRPGSNFIIGLPNWKTVLNYTGLLSVSFAYFIAKKPASMPTQNVEFTNSNGYQLSAKLEFPANSKPHTYAIFAHCFTCNKNLSAMRNISRAMNMNGIAVLRFDFTGLGESEGDFSDTNFTSNIQDLIAAAAFPRRKLFVPRLSW